MECLDCQQGIQGGIFDGEAQKVKGHVEKLTPWHFFLLLNYNVLWDTVGTLLILLAQGELFR